MSMELQNIIDRDELTKDTMKLQEYNDRKDVEKIINEFRSEFISRYDDDNSDYAIEIITAVFKFSEELKENLHN